MWCCSANAIPDASVQIAVWRIGLGSHHAHRLLAHFSSQLQIHSMKISHTSYFCSLDLGREGSHHGIDDYVEIKYLCLGDIQK
jgi:hypothetical protein